MLDEKHYSTLEKLALNYKKENDVTKKIDMTINAMEYIKFALPIDLRDEALIYYFDKRV